MSAPPAARPTLTRHVAAGIHRLRHANANMYLIEDAGRVTLVDAGYPRSFRLLPRALAAIGRARADVAALLLTHAHPDHLGFARRIRTEWGVPVHAHRDEAYLARHPFRYARSAPGLPYLVRYPRVIAGGTRMLLAGVAGTRGITDLEFFAGGELDVPGRPVALPTPGHTLGHTAFHLPDRDALLTGDALVTINPYTSETGPRLVALAATADVARAVDSLDALAATGARIVLPGHGEPWREGIRAAVAAARLAGFS